MEKKDIVLIPGFDRPEFFYWCLQMLLRNPGAENYHYVFALDRGYNKKHHEIFDGTINEPFPHSYEVITPAIAWNGMVKQSYNLLTAWMYCASKAKNYVILVEDDVMVADDFLQYHDSVHSYNRDQDQQIFSVQSTENHNREVHVDITDAAHLYRSNGDYCSLGVSISVDVLQNHIRPHCCVGYYRNPVNYCVENFPHSSIGRYFAEQDGLIRRIQERSGLFTLYPYKPRSYHSGYYGKNRMQARALGSTLIDKINYLATVIFNDEQMKRKALNPHFYRDSRPVSLTNGNITELSILDLS